MRARVEIERILVADLEIAFTRFRSAVAAFKGVINDVPSGIPHPDGSLRIRQAADEKMAAAIQLRRALGRHNAFFIEGKVPADGADYRVHAVRKRGG